MQEIKPLRSSNGQVETREGLLSFLPQISLLLPSYNQFRTLSTAYISC